jgi:hypothetical protein
LFLGLRCCHLFLQMASTRIGQTIRQLLFTGMSGGTAAAAAAAAGPQHPRQQQARTAEQRQQRWDKVRQSVLRYLV